MLSNTNQNSNLFTSDTIYASFLRNIQNWVRREVLDDDPYDDVALREEALLTAFIEQKQMHGHHPYPAADVLSPDCQGISSMLRQNLQNPGCL